MTALQLQARALRDARKAARSDGLDQRIPVLTRDFDQQIEWRL